MSFHNFFETLSKKYLTNPTSQIEIPADSGDIIRCHLLFVGIVQCVGFRYEALRLANHLHLTGWVRNMENESVVTMELQGTPERIDCLIQEMNAIPRIVIDRIDRTQIPIIKDETAFNVVY
ncbi:MAG: acylphosphatase [Hespellia sp.]|nr:acylphosphatase [Hespellia sp.]